MNAGFKSLNVQMHQPQVLAANMNNGEAHRSESAEAFR